jgi:hypothetical protein
MRHIELKVWIRIIWIVEQNKAESNQSKLGKRVLHELNIKSKIQSNTW